MKHMRFGLVPALFIGFATLFELSADGSARHDLVSKGRHIYFNETFGGNGRTCATCHRAKRTFSNETAFVSALQPVAPSFLARFLPRLETNAQPPELVRAIAVIPVSVAGHKRPPHLRPPIESLQQPEPAWSSDGARSTCPASIETHAPERCADFDGTVRAFALGAVLQHFPRNLRRVPGPDFRLPSDEELDALEAYQLSLGRKGAKTGGN